MIVNQSDPWDPGSPRNRDRTRESQKQVRAILMEWDPIGVSDAPEAADEYDFMISPLMHLLYDGTDEQELLGRITFHRDYMGLGEDTIGADRQIAANLLHWWAARRRSE
jgi:hypothetical protein